MTDLEAVMFYAKWQGRYEANRDEDLRKADRHTLSAEMRLHFRDNAFFMQQEAEKNRRLAEEAALRVRAVLFAAADREATP